MTELLMGLMLMTLLVALIGAPIVLILEEVHKSRKETEEPAGICSVCGELDAWFDDGVPMCLNCFLNQRIEAVE